MSSSIIKPALPSVSFVRPPILVTLQFNCRDEKIIPRSIKRIEREGLESSDQRKNRHSGQILIQTAEPISLEALVSDLAGQDYLLVGALGQQRRDQRDPTRMYYMSRFSFAQPDATKRGFDDFVQVRPQIIADLQRIIDQAIWQMRAYDNPYFREGVEVAGERMLSLNFDARLLLRQADNQPVCRWVKNAQGQRIGDRPVPLRASAEVRFSRSEDNELSLSLRSS